MDAHRTEKHEQARNSLPESVRPVFDDFVADYRFAATKVHGSPFVSYMVMAEMVRAGWRLAAEPIREDSEKKESPMISLDRVGCCLANDPRPVPGLLQDPRPHRR